ncbi:mucin-2-like [Embiotoca jacksoni]|uniref:mucin-2-like n=1 Tax=Embiotoca jacksoni TaxID=100190 RepID=UPI0037043071
MKSSSTPSSSPPVTSVTSVTRLLPSSSPRLSLQTPELQAEFLRECRNKLQSPRDLSDSSPSSSSPLSPSSSTSSSTCSSRQARLSLSNPELLSELRESRTRPLRHVPAHNGLTTVFSGRGRARGNGHLTPPPP